VWTLARIADAEARTLVRDFLADSDDTVRQAAIHVSSLWKDWGATSRLVELLQGPSDQNRRAAAEALGRIGNKSAIPAILEASSKAGDRISAHSLTYALIEIGDPLRTQVGLQTASPLTRRTALVALDQMDDSRLDATEVARLLVSREPLLKETASWIVGRHPEWAASLATVMGQQIDRADLTAADRSELEQQLGRFAKSAEIRSLLADRLGNPKAAREARKSALRAMAWSNLDSLQVPGTWVTAIVHLINDRSPASDVELIDLAVATARTLKPTGDRSTTLRAPLMNIAGDDSLRAELRLDAMAALPKGLDHTSPAVFTFLIDQLKTDRPVATRTTAADVLAKAKLSQDQLLALATALRSAGPVEVGRLLDAFDQSNDEALGLKLVEDLGHSAALSSLRIDALKAHLAKFGDSVKQRAEELYVRLNVDLPKQQARLKELLGTLAAGDVRRGQLVFHSEKAACYSCHAIGYRGGNVGPDLTKIGSVRSQRDLLEAIVYPSASFVRSYEPLVIATSDGKVYNGLIRGENAEELLLATGVNQETKITRRAIDEIRPSTVSVMPSGFDQQLAPQELADLIAFLRACR
jgi:putative heme-binding domain-containing protein